MTRQYHYHKILLYNDDYLLSYHYYQRSITDIINIQVYFLNSVVISFRITKYESIDYDLKRGNVQICII